VYLQEGPWPEKAQFDAHRLARQRDAAVYLNYGYTRPSVISEGGVRQNPEGMPPALQGPEFLQEGMPTEALPEVLPEGAEMLPTPDGAMTSPGVSTMMGMEPPAQRSNLDRAFAWGPLGLNPDGKQPQQDDTWSRIVGGGSNAEAKRPAGTALQQPRSQGTGDLGAAPSPGSASSTGNRVTPASHQQPQSTSQHESQSRQSNDPVARPAASR
jgi:hypothetical protein